MFVCGFGVLFVHFCNFVVFDVLCPKIGTIRKKNLECNFLASFTLAFKVHTLFLLLATFCLKAKCLELGASEVPSFCKNNSEKCYAYSILVVQ